MSNPIEERLNSVLTTRLTPLSDLEDSLFTHVATPLNTIAESIMHRFSPLSALVKSSPRRSIALATMFDSPGARAAAVVRHGDLWRCAQALEDFSHHPESAKQFVTQGLNLSLHYCTAVWQALAEGRWYTDHNPLPSLRQAARDLYRKDEKPKPGDILGIRRLSLDTPGAQGTLLTVPLRDPADPIGKLERCLDTERTLEHEGRQAGLSADAMLVYKLHKLYGAHISKRTLARLLHWDQKRVNRAWREKCRKGKKSA